MTLLIRRITLAVLSLALVGAAVTLPAAAKNDAVAVASKKCKKKGKKASAAKKKKRCGSGSGSGSRGESTLPGVPTRPSPQQPAPPATPPPVLVSGVSLTDSIVLGGTNTDGQVTINSPAPTGGQQVDLQSSDSSRASVPSAVQVAAGQTTANFTVGTSIGPTVDTTVSASIGGSSQSVPLRVVDKPSVVDLHLQDNCFRGTSLSNYGANRVTLDVTAPIDEVVSLGSDSASLTVPTSVTVPAGSKTAIFGIGTAPPVQTSPPVTVTGTLFSSSAFDTAPVIDTTTPSALTGLSLSPDHVTVGNPSTGNVTLDCEAPSGGTVVSLHSDNTDVTFANDTPDDTVTIPQGKLSPPGGFQISTAAIGTATISATIGGTGCPTCQQTLTVEGLGT